LGSNHLPYTIN